MALLVLSRPKKTLLFLKINVSGELTYFAIFEEVYLFVNFFAHSILPFIHSKHTESLFNSGSVAFIIWQRIVIGVI